MKSLYLIFLFFIAIISTASSSVKLDNVKTYLVYYGRWNLIEKQKALEYDLIILHPGKDNRNITPELVDQLKKGKDKKLGTSDDIKIIAYVTIGEDDNPLRSIRQNKFGFEGPVNYSNGKRKKLRNGYREWYLDMVSLKTDKNNETIWQKHGLPQTEKGHDGIPDENGKWGSFYVDVSNHEWQTRVLRQMAWLTESNNVDGIFLDTIDTASPWGNYGFLQDKMVDFLVKIRKNFPQTILIMNRGLFLFEKHGTILNKNIDGLMFESYVSEWDWYQNKATRHPWFNSNKFILEQHIRPLTKKRNGIKLFFLNYIKENQEYYKSFTDILYRDSHDLNSIHYYSSPDLHSIKKPINEILNIRKKRNLNLKTFLEDHRIRIDLSKEPTLRNLSNDHFTVNISSQKHPIRQWPFEMIKKKGDIITLPFLQENEYHIELLNRNSTEYALYRSKIAVPKFNNVLNPIQSISIKAYDSEIQISWKKHPLAQKVLLEIESKNESPKVIETKELSYTFKGLKNNQTYFLRVKPHKEAIKSFYSEIYAATPSDCTPPLAPILEEPNLKKNKCTLLFSPNSKKDLAGFHLYVDNKDLKHRGLPIKLLSYERMKKIEFDKKGVYEISLTAYDGHNNESTKSKKYTIEIK